MGFIEAFKGALGGSFADQWKDFYTIPHGISATAAVFPAAQQTTNAGRGVNAHGSANIITNGSKILVPEGFSLVTLENGAITGFIAEPGGYVFSTDSTYSQSFFAGGGIVASTLKNSWERFKFGGIPGDQQMAFYVNLKEIPGNRFGTQSEIYWDDAYLNAQAGALTRGTYSLKIVDPILFVKGFVPVRYLSEDALVFDFADFENDAASQLFNEVVQSLSAAFSNYTNDPSRERRITRIQGDSIGLALSLSQAVESAYQWQTARGLEIVSVALQAIEYDETTKTLLAEVQKVDALGAGQRGNAFLQQSVARGIEAAGSNPSGGGSVGIGMMGMGLNAAMGAAAGFQQTGTPTTGNPFAAEQTAAAATVAAAATGAAVGGAATTGAAAGDANAAGNVTGDAGATNAASATGAANAAVEDPYEKLTKLKGLLDAGVITQEDFDSAKARILE
jgi:membrane protease subunit (stomatin/prohibitin family)